MIQANTLTKYYGNSRGIERISFTVEQGEIVGLLGLNGAGKSTILKILGCFLLPSGGKASIGGFDVEDESHKVRALVGYLPDTPPLYDEMDVSSYLSFVAALKGVPPKQVGDSVNIVLDRTNLKEVEDVRILDLSHGFRQRVGIAQALVHNPPVLIFDEPINGLDPVQIVEMRDLILNLKGKHTVILSSHILSEVTKTCDRMMIVDQGKLVAQGSESSLKAGLRDHQEFVCQARSITPAILEHVRSMSAIKNMKHSTIRGVDTLNIEATSDIRSELARILVQNGADLLTLKASDDDLENLFVKLIDQKSELSGGQ